MVGHDLIEARQAHTFRLFLFIVANRFTAPDTLDHKGDFCLIHAMNLTAES
jgi:hypothetical protein